MMIQIRSYRNLLIVILLLCLALVLGNIFSNANSVWRLDQAVQLQNCDPNKNGVAKGPCIYIQDCNNEHCVDVGVRA